MRMFGLIFILLWTIPVMIWGYNATVAMNKAQETGDFSGIAEIVEGPAPVAWLRNRAEVNNAFRLDKITDSRLASYEIILPFADVLAEGETPPNPTFQTLYATARAPALIHQYCPELLQTVAQTCQVLTSKAQILRDGAAKITGSVGYIPTYDLGDPSSVENGDMRAAYVNLLGRNYLPNTVEGRQEAIAKATAFCDLLRAEFGNCIVANVSFSPTQRNGENLTGASVRIGAYVNKSAYSRTVFRNTVQTMFEQFDEGYAG